MINGRDSHYRNFHHQNTLELNLVIVLPLPERYLTKKVEEKSASLMQSKHGNDFIPEQLKLSLIATFFNLNRQILGL